MKTLGLLRFLPRAFGLSGQIRTKGWYASKTIWKEILVLAVDVVQYLGYLPGVELGEVESIAVAITAIVGIYLRTVTDKPLGIKTEVEPLALVPLAPDAPVFPLGLQSAPQDVNHEEFMRHRDVDAPVERLPDPPDTLPGPASAGAGRPAPRPAGSGGFNSR